MRTILNRLVAAGLAVTSSAGCSLSFNGLQVWSDLEDVFPKRTEFLYTDITPSKFNYGFLVRRSGDKVRSGMEQRDVAIVERAIRALIIVFQGEHLHINSVSDDITRVFPDVAHHILKTFNPQENDVIIVAGGDTALKATRGAFAASWSLLAMKWINIKEEI